MWPLSFIFSKPDYMLTDFIDFFGGTCGYNVLCSHSPRLHPFMNYELLLIHMCLFIFFFGCLGVELRTSCLVGRYATTRATCQPCFVLSTFQIGSCRTICRGWLWAMILLISASWIARIIGISHQHPALFSKILIQFSSCLSFSPWREKTVL
jgi:hypothetical protein